jgi:hypothetical protein
MGTFASFRNAAPRCVTWDVSALCELVSVACFRLLCVVREARRRICICRGSSEEAHRVVFALKKIEARDRAFLCATTLG